MSPVRVLVVDDSVVMRRLLSQVLEEDGELEVTTAANGVIALAKLASANPDVVVLDVEMPELDGLGTLRELRQINASLPVIMFSTLTERGAAATLEAITLGASDYVTKPSKTGGIDESRDRVRQELVPKVMALAERARRPARPASARPRPTSRPTRTVRHRVDVVAIGASTGGPNALSQVLSALPAELPVPVVITQHMPPVFTRLLAERLDATCAIEVREAVGGEELTPGTAWIAPGDHHLVVRACDGGVELALDEGPPEHSCRPAVDVMFRAVAEVYGSHALGVVLTGMGSDGQRGAEMLDSFGSAVLVQDEATSVVWGMPGSVVKAGVADEELPLELVAGGILRRVGRHRGPTHLAEAGGVRW